MDLDRGMSGKGMGKSDSAAEHSSAHSGPAFGWGMKGKGMGDIEETSNIQRPTSNLERERSEPDSAAEHATAKFGFVPVFVWFVWFAVEHREKLKC
jgi:hypothetical protein